MKQHLIAGVVAAAVASGISVYAPPKVTQIHHEIALSKHAWPDLTEAQRLALAETWKATPPRVKIDIVCNDAGCSDLAADIDDAAEDAGVDSQLDKAIGPLGYGIAIQANEFDKAEAEQMIAAIAQATDGALAPQFLPGKPPAGY